MPWRVFTTDNDSQDEQASGLFGKRESDAKPEPSREVAGSPLA